MKRPEIPVIIAVITSVGVWESGEIVVVPVKLRMQLTKVSMSRNN